MRYQNHVQLTCSHPNSGQKSTCPKCGWTFQPPYSTSVSPPVPARRLASYTLTELYDLETQGAALLPGLESAAATRMVDVLAAIAGEIADRRWPENLAAHVCGYADDGSLLPAVETHRYARIARRR